jgi:ketosteroid isomerase-like protein
MLANLTRNEKTVLDFLKMVEERKSSDELEKFYHPDIEQIEFPNAITKATAFRNLAALKEGSEKGAVIMSEETYDVKKLYSIGEIVILEATWKGTLSIPIGNIPQGGQMTANFAQFYEFKDGKIYRQRNYDCFDPF